jgi:hypothetical protein
LRLIARIGEFKGAWRTLGTHPRLTGSLESVIEANKEPYYLALRQMQGTTRSDAPDWQPWLSFFLRSLDVCHRCQHNTLLHFRNLIERQHLEQHDRERGAWCGLK